MDIPKGIGLTLTTVGFTILLFSLVFVGERFFDILDRGIFLGILITLVGIFVYMNSKKSNGMIHVR